MTPQTNGWKTAFIALALATIGTGVYLALRLLDNSATTSAYKDHCTRIEAAFSLLCVALPDALRSPKHGSQQEFLSSLQKHNRGGPIVSGQTNIEMDQVRFLFAPDGSLDRIERTDDYGTSATNSPMNRPAIH